MCLLLKGRIPVEDKKYIEDFSIRETWTEVRTEEAGDEENSVYFERGISALSSALGFLSVMEDAKGEKLNRIIENGYERRFEDEKHGYSYSFTVREAREIYELIKEIPQKYDEFIDDELRLRPEKTELVEQIAPYLIRHHYHYSDQDVLVKMVDYSQWQTNQLIKFFELANRLRREVWVN